ncbi:MAG: hypothetical protein IKO19_12815 [Candidatus Riflebacteria bacterium]|nr:hypothetical protein [Candidatus Riflebacteria bacterium]MBR4571532.1 hypothetical protein [Candidatus Riflebacteria bacterium]
MEIWQFWIGIGIILALLGVIVAILVKKHRNKHRIVTLQKNLDDLERSFKFLCEEIETTADLNIKTMEEKIESMRELLTVADKKCLYIDELLDAVEKGAKTLKERNLSFGSQIISSPIDEEKIMELVENKIAVLTERYNNEIITLNKHFGFLKNRIEVLEEKLSGNSLEPFGIDKELQSEISSIKRDIKNIENSISETVTNEISKQLSILDEGFAEVAETAVVADEMASNNGMNNGFEPESNVTELFPKFVDSPTSHKKDSDLKIPQNFEIEYYPKGKELIVKEIMEKYEQGISIPQIASELKMCRSEIQLIIKMNERMLEAKKVGSYGN